jgi:hypothetical protein
MPDLTTEHATACQTQREWSKKVPSLSDPSKTYTLSWGRLWGLASETVGSLHGYSCTCWPFRQKGVCSHATAAYAVDQSGVSGPDDRCGWDNRFMAPTEPTAEGKCPLCDSDTFTYAYGA